MIGVITKRTFNIRKSDELRKQLKELIDAGYIRALSYSDQSTDLKQDKENRREFRSRKKKMQLKTNIHSSCRMASSEKAGKEESKRRILSF